MPTAAPLARWLLAPLCGLLLLAPAAGCGGTRKKGQRTIAERLARARADASPGGPARELTKVARARLASGDKAGAVATLAEARATIPDDADAAIFGPRLVDIAAAYAAVPERDSAARAIAAALATAERVGDPVAKVELLAAIGAVSGGKKDGLGDASGARTILRRAADLATAADVGERFRPQALAAVATGYASADLAGDAREVMERLESLATGLQDLRARAEALAAAGSVRARTGAKDAAAALLADASAAARAIDGPANRAFALLAVARAMRAAGDTAGAAALAAEAEKAASRIGDPEQQKEALRDIRGLKAAIAD